MKKIAFLNKYQDKVNRGAETFVKEVSQRLSKNYQVDIISDINYFNLLKKKYDLIIPTNGRFQVVVTRLITWLTGGKTIVSGQSGMGWDDRVNLYSLPNLFISLSTEALRWAKKVNPLIKSVYIPNGVDTKKFISEGEKIKIDLKKPIILCVGALTKTKRIDFVIKAVSKLEDASLLIVGKGEEEYNLRNLGERYLKGRFKIMNFPYEKMPEVYRIANVFTLVSESYYSFENVLVEAMATNIPVVANDDPIRKEIVGDGGLLIDPSSTDVYIEALRKAMKTNWSSKPREQAIRFDWDKIATEYGKLISGLI
jgi:glycosyltransferase involved in cell wall biosynthesis